MKTQVPRQAIPQNSGRKFFRTHGAGKKLSSMVALLCIMFTLFSETGTAQPGSFAALANGAPSANNGVMLLLPDGRAMCKSQGGGGSGNQWDLLTPDINGSYQNGTWVTAAAMAKTRLYFCSHVLQDGRVWVAGGEYGTGGNFGEIYNPQTDTWSGEINYGVFISDANSEILDNSYVIAAPVGDRPNTFIWNPNTNTFVAGPDNGGNTNESSWLKLPDNSILYVRTNTTISERYIPATNTWEQDANVPVSLYEPLGSECGGNVMLPDGRGWFIGGLSATAYYTPSGNTTDGVWAAAPTIPNSLCAPDAAAAMMRNGRVLCAFSPYLTCCDGGGNNIFNSPTSYWDFDYLTGTYDQVNAPGGGLTINMPAYQTNMLDLPNGQVLYSHQGSSQYYVYTPGGPQLNANRPFITDVSQTSPGVFTLTGLRINGWSEGATYGDDWQMNTNYPIVRLTSGGGNVYYARTYNWSSTRISTGSTPHTTNFVLPGGLPAGTYSLQVIANGIASAAVSFCTPNIDVTASVTSNYNGRDVSCFGSTDGSATASVVGGIFETYEWSTGAFTASISGLSAGTYTVTVTNLFGLVCPVTQSVTLNNPPLLTLPALTLSNFNGYNISCNGGSNGTATANPSGGTTAYGYSWSNGQSTATATGLSAGTYTVTVTDANGCNVSRSATLTEPPLLTTTAAATSNYNGFNVRCHGGSDGEATAYPVGGVAPYGYSWTSGSSSNPATGLSATTYTVTVTDANGCTATASATLTEPPILTIDAGPNKIVYWGYPDSACAKLQSSGAGGGVPPRTLLWSTGSTATFINVCPTATTVYYLTISDANGCSITDSVKVCVFDVRCGTALNNIILCHGTGSATNPYVTLCVDLQGAKWHFKKHPGETLAACGTIKVCSFVTERLETNFDAITDGVEYLGAFPNPFSNTTTIRFMLPENDFATVKVIDVAGREIEKLFDGATEAGDVYDVTFDGSKFTNGIYFLVMQTRSGVLQTRKLILDK
ncbi:MAG TPA: T9SS type A sorting domain-containing protein [Bacteroidia bacterium]|nr:T9SS type A sorting domain-containing protein [Bacteroidia bacterium]